MTSGVITRGRLSIKKEFFSVGLSLCFVFFSKTFVLIQKHAFENSAIRTNATATCVDFPHQKGVTESAYLLNSEPKLFYFSE